MFDFILSSLILLLCALFSFIAGVKFIKLLSKAVLEFGKLPYDKKRKF